MIRRTSINLDQALVNAAKRVMGTTTTTETVHRALAEIVRHERLKRLARRTFDDLSPEALTRLRTQRTPSGQEA